LEIETVLKRFLLGVPQKFNVAKGKSQFNAVEIKINEIDGKCLEIKQIIYEDIGNE
jgi:calcineurin-like phosphoesterase